SSTPPPTTDIYTLSLHDALPDLHGQRGAHADLLLGEAAMQIIDAAHPAIAEAHDDVPLAQPAGGGRAVRLDGDDQRARLDAQLRSEEHTSELQSQSNLVCRLLLE